jgi:hypothetical protein
VHIPSYTESLNNPSQQMILLGVLSHQESMGSYVLKVEFLIKSKGFFIVLPNP